MTNPTPNEDPGALAAYGDALSRILVSAMRPLQAEDPASYLVLMSGIEAGQIRLRLVTDCPLNQPGKMTLYAYDSNSTEREIATLHLNPGATN